MSKKDIQTVCELAAHLASVEAAIAHGVPDEHYNRRFMAGKIAADAMALQRLGRSARNADKRCMRRAPRWTGTYQAACERIVREADAILSPYGLCSQVSDAGIFILGLPGNTLGGDEDGYGI